MASDARTASGADGRRREGPGGCASLAGAGQSMVTPGTAATVPGVFSTRRALNPPRS